MLFEIGPVFKGSKPGEQLAMIGAIKTENTLERIG